MKAIFSFFFMVFFFSVGISQQPKIVVDEKKQQSATVEGACIITQSAFVGYDVNEKFVATTKGDLLHKIKLKAFEDFFSANSMQYNTTVLEALAWHANEYIKVNVEDIRKKGNNYDLYVEKVKIEKDAVLSIAEAINKYFSAKTIVIYNPVKFKGREDMAEEIRSRTQSVYKNSEFQRNDMLLLDAMPNIKVEGSGEGLNFFDVLLTGISDYFKEKRLYPKVAIIVQDYSETKSDISDELKQIDAEIHIVIFNMNTYSIIVDKYVKGVGTGSSYTIARQDAIERIMNKNIEFLYKEESNTYYKYVIDGRKFNMAIDRDCFDDDDDILDEFEDALLENCVTLEEANDEDDVVVYEGYTQATSQRLLKRIIRTAVKSANGISGRVKAKGEMITIEPKE